MPTPEGIRILKTEVEADLAAVASLTAELAEARTSLPADAPQKDLRNAAYLLHGIYTAWESALHRIANTFENRLDPAAWHTQLLFRMVLEVPGIRPAVLDANLRADLEELRSFRHFFRHNYAAPFRQARLELVLSAYDAVKTAVPACLRRFVAAVATIADSSEGA